MNWGLLEKVVIKDNHLDQAGEAVAQIGEVVHMNLVVEVMVEEDIGVVEVEVVARKYLVAVVGLVGVKCKAAKVEQDLFHIQLPDHSSFHIHLCFLKL